MAVNETLSGVRGVRALLPATPTSDGAGVALTRYFDPRSYALLDPFLLFDAFGSDDPDAYLAGFPDHPHRGFETVTYMLAGVMEHRDSVGNRGLLEPGSVQWMSAGRGIIHAEMPRQVAGRMAGFQLWVNLPAARKMSKPRYQDIAAHSIPVVTLEGGVSARLLAGRLGGVDGPVRDVVTAPLYADVRIPAGVRWRVPLDAGLTAFVHLFEGAATLGAVTQARPVGAGELVLLERRPQLDAVEITASANAAARLLLVAARPLGEPMAHGGPFVMSSRAEIDAAFAAYRDGTLVG